MVSRAVQRARSITAYPAEKRAAAIESRIIAAAEDEGLSTAQLRTVESERSTDVLAGQQVLTSVFDADAVLEGIDRHTLAGAYLARIREAIDSYRSDRTPEHVRAAASCRQRLQQSCSFPRLRSSSGCAGD
jgi:hypothetical protein